MFSTTPSFRRKREKKGVQTDRERNILQPDLSVISTKIPETEMQVKHGTSLELALDLQASFC